MITRSISEARRKLADLIELARQGEEVFHMNETAPDATRVQYFDSQVLYRLPMATVTKPLRLSTQGAGCRKIVFAASSIFTG